MFEIVSATGAPLTLALALVDHAQPVQSKPPKMPRLS